jgi:sugar-specific transcriptional regulator TrmB/predicted hydrocarbon binding protein
VGRPGEALIALLGEHGIDEPAARLYLAASRHGPRSASELARLTALDRVQAYRWIKLLSEQGLMRVGGRRPMRFAAVPLPELLDRFIRGAAERLDRLRTGRERWLSDWQESLSDPQTYDGGAFSVLEGMNRIHHFLSKRIGLARREILISTAGYALAFAIQGGVDRALKQAVERGVKVRFVTEIGPGNLTEAKYFRGFTDLRQAAGPVPHRALVIDGAGAIVWVTGQQGLGESEANQVAVWSTAPRFVRLARESHRRLWARGRRADERIVEVDSPSGALLPMYREGESDALNRLTEVARLGMQATGLKVLNFDLPELIDTVARQLGREMAKELSGATPSEVAQSLVSFYDQHAMGRLTIVRENPLTLRVSGCFACTHSSPEVGRVLCPGMLRSALESRLGVHWDVSKPDPRRHATRGCLFTVTPV